jgi:hypothetical protein
LTTTLPGPVQDAAAAAFIAGSRIVPDAIDLQYFNAGFVDSPVRSIQFEESGGPVVRAYSFVGTQSVTVAIHRRPLESNSIEWGSGWQPTATLHTTPNVLTVFTVAR